MTQPEPGQRVRLVLEGIYSTFDTGVPNEPPWHDLHVGDGVNSFDVALPPHSLLIVSLEVLPE